MSYLDLYMNQNPLITSPSDEGESSTIVYGIPFDSTHSYRPGTRFGPDAIREAFNNIEIFMPQFSVDLESFKIEDLGNTKHTVVAQEMLEQSLERLRNRVGRYISFPVFDEFIRIIKEIKPTGLSALKVDTKF